MNPKPVETKEEFSARHWAVIGLALWLAAPASRAGSEFKGPSPAALAATVPARAAVISPSRFQELEAIAKTQTLEAATVLIRALVYNFDPGVSNEARGGAEAIPSIGLLKQYFGEAVIPLLLCEALTSESDVMQDRAGFAAACLASREAAGRWRQVLSLETSTNPRAARLDAALRAGPGRVPKLATKHDAEGAQVDELLKNRSKPK